MSDEIKFESVSEIVDYLAKLEAEIMALEAEKKAKVEQYKRVSSELVGASSFGELTISKLFVAIENVLKLQKNQEAKQ